MAINPQKLLPGSTAFTASTKAASSPNARKKDFKSAAKDVLITSQLRTALIINKKTKARNYTLETINKEIYIFGIAFDEEEKKEVINEANKIYNVENVIPSIYLVSELSRNKN